MSGGLWGTLVRRAESALAAGALQPLSTRAERVEDAGVSFVVRVLDGLRRKREGRRAQRGNPFLPYEEAMFVADLSDTHVALLNKFNVLQHHLLIVTRRFEDQRKRLTLGDFEALLAAMAEIDGLGFYNGGAEAGASQPHKHLQLVPLPLAPDGPPLPIEPLLDGIDETPRAIRAIPFRHRAAVRRGGDAREALALYEQMRDDLQAGERPFNLLLTRDWMMFVPRLCEHFESVSVNALGFAGSLFVRDEDELALVRRARPMRLLRSVTEESRS